MRRASGVLAFMAGAALVVTTAVAALGQEEEPAPEATMAPETSMAPEASTEAEVVEPSTLEIIDVAADKTAATPLKGKKLKKAVAKAAPAAAGYVIESAGDDAIGQIIGLSLAARAADEAGDPKAAVALIDIASLLYRKEWTSTKSDPAALNAAIQEAVDAAGLTGDPALLQQAIWDRWIDICNDPGGAWFGSGPDDNPSSCEDEGGTMVRADFTGIEPDQNTTPEEVGLEDAGGFGIHKVTQDKTANDKLTGKKYKKAWAKALKKHAPTIASSSAGGPDAIPEQQVIEYVLLAREADEAGDQKAANAFMKLALAAYRSGLPGPGDTGEYNNSIAGLADAAYAESPGLEVSPPGDGFDVCFDRKGKYLYCSDRSSPWECEAMFGGKLERLTFDEAVCNYCPEAQEDYHPEPSC